MTDKEMQMLAAQAAGLKVKTWWEKYPGEWWADLDCERQLNDLPTVWSSLHDDGDAMRLDARTGVFFRPEFAHFLTLERFAGQEHDDIRAHRRAITRAAAALAVSDLAKMEGAPMAKGGQIE